MSPSRCISQFPGTPGGSRGPLEPLAPAPAPPLPLPDPDEDRPSWYDAVEPPERGERSAMPICDVEPPAPDPEPEPKTLSRYRDPIFASGCSGESEYGAYELLSSPGVVTGPTHASGRNAGSGSRRSWLRLRRQSQKPTPERRAMRMIGTATAAAIFPLLLFDGCFGCRLTVEEFPEEETRPTQELAVTTGPVVANSSELFAHTPFLRT